MTEKVEGPNISVLLMAYNRTDFIDSALDSVLSQSIPPHSYEIVVVKNFSHYRIDNMCLEGTVTCVNSDAEDMGKFILEGLRNCKAEVIAFLEDDDLWVPEKLSIVKKAFEESPGLLYFHNSVTAISESGNISTKVRAFESQRWHSSEGIIKVDSTWLRRNIRNFGSLFPDFNLSSIAINKAMISSAEVYISQMETAIDTLLFVLSISHGGNMILHSKRLTKYRQHSKNQSGRADSNLSEHLSALFEFTTRALRSYKRIVEWSESEGNDISISISQRRYAFTALLNSIQNPHTNRRRTTVKMIKLLPHLFTFDSFLNSKAILLGIMYIFFPEWSRSLLARNL